MEKDEWRVCGVWGRPQEYLGFVERAPQLRLGDVDVGLVWGFAASGDALTQPTRCNESEVRTWARNRRHAKSCALAFLGFLPL